MNGEWRVRTRFRELRLHVRPPSTGGQLPAGVTPLVSDLVFDVGTRNLPLDPRLASLVDVLRTLGALDGPLPPSPRAFGRALEDAVRSGRLVVEELRAPPAPVLPDLDAPEPAPAPEPGEDPALTFVEVEIRDKDGNPVSTGFRVQLADGEVREGHTGIDGRGRIDGVKPGEAQVVFVDWAEPCVTAA